MKKEAENIKKNNLLIITLIILILPLVIGESISGKVVSNFQKFKILDAKIIENKLSVKIESGKESNIGFLARVLDNDKKELTKCTAFESIKSFEIRWFNFKCENNLENAKYLEVYPCRDVLCENVYTLYKEEFTFKEEKLIMKVDDKVTKTEFNEFQQDNADKTLFEGELEILHEDDFENRKSKTDYFLRTIDNQLYKLIFDKEPNVISGNVKIYGILDKKSKQIQVSINDIIFLDGGLRGTPSVTLGEQRTVVILAEPANLELNPMINEDYVTSVMNQVNSYYLENSYDQTWFNWDLFGPYTIPFDYEELYNLAYCGLYEVRNHIVTDPVIDQYVGWTQYRRLVIIQPRYPSGYTCTPRGTISLNNVNTPDGNVMLSTAIIYPLNATQNLIGTFSHELGHNLGVHHANDWECGNEIVGYGNLGVDGCTSIEYGDDYDVMGVSDTPHMNSVHKEKIWWLNNDDIIESDGLSYNIYDISPIEIDNNYPKVIKIPRYGDTGRLLDHSYYLEYRRPIGFDNSIRGIGDSSEPLGIEPGIYLHLNYTSYDDNGITGDTQLLDTTPDYDSVEVALREGENYYDIDSGFTIEVIELTDTYAKVSVSSSGMC